MDRLFIYALFIVPSLMCLVAAVILELPESYYTFLRVIVFICAIAVGYLLWRRNVRNLAIYPYILVAIVFNPATEMFPAIYQLVTQPVWIVADLVAIVIFLTGLWFYRKEESPA